MYCFPFSKIISISILLIIFFTFSIYAIEPEWGNATNLRQINSPKDDFAPQWNPFEKRLYFASNRTGKSKFFVTQFDDFLNFTTPKDLTDPLNKTTSNVSYISFVSETEAVLNAFRKGYAQAYLNIFYSQRRLGQWQKPIPLDSLQCECFVLHPTVSPDGSFMVFSSNVGGSNQLDLYIAYRRENGVWGNLEKIEELSTDGDEITPFLASNDTLYFSSNGFGGPGGFDLFYSVRKNNIWQSPIPLSRLNTRFDESDFTMINDTLAVFASNNIDGLGGLDLYLARRQLFEEVAYEPMPKLDLNISVQIPIITIQQELEYELAQFPQILPLDFVYWSEEEKNSDISIFDSIEVLFQNYFQELFNRIVKSNKEVSLGFDTTNEKLYRLITYNIEKYQKKFENLRNLVKIEQKPSEFVIIQTEHSELFEPIKIGKLKEMYEPPVLEVSINARPEKLLSSFTFSLRHTGIRRNGTKVPFFGTIVLTSDSLFAIRKSDSLFIDLIADDTLGRSYLVSYPIILKRSSVFYKKTIIFQNKRYQRYYLFAPFFDFEDRADVKNIMKELGEYSENIKEIVLITDLDNKEQILSYIIAQIVSNLGLSSNKVNILRNIAEYEKSFGKVPRGCAIMLVEMKQ